MMESQGAICRWKSMIYTQRQRMQELELLLRHSRQMQILQFGAISLSIEK
jgi:hypothetical protein